VYVNHFHFRFKKYLNLGCLNPVERVRSGDGVFYPSTQRHYLLDDDRKTKTCSNIIYK
jgi:hypothetical protein